MSCVPTHQPLRFFFPAIFVIVDRLLLANHQALHLHLRSVKLLPRCLAFLKKFQKFITRWVQKHCTMKGFGCTSFCSKQFLRSFLNTVQGTKISHLGKKKIIFKHALGGDILVSRRVNHVESHTTPVEIHLR